MTDLQRFSGTDRYIATDDLMMAVNAAITLARPLLIKGEPGEGDRGIHSHHELVGGDVLRGAGEALLFTHK